MLLCIQLIGKSEVRILIVRSEEMGTYNNNSLLSKDAVLRAIRDKVVTVPLTIVESLLLFFILQQKDRILQLQPASLPILLLIMLISIPLLTLLFLYVYKYRKLRKYILTMDPQFEDHMEFDRWFEYYAKKHI